MSASSTMDGSEIIPLAQIQELILLQICAAKHNACSISFSSIVLKSNLACARETKSGGKTEDSRADFLLEESEKESELLS
jgi:hypothetical protein